MTASLLTFRNDPIEPSFTDEQKQRAYDMALRLFASATLMEPNVGEFQSGGMGITGAEVNLEVHRGPRSALHVEIERRKEAEAILKAMCAAYGASEAAYRYFDKYPDLADV